ncbi:sensor histidine kinase [Nitrosopumilus sp.]|uniref:sensor histidine kinase n=1 Tax=Nitrosopumilus sp. TaxID=2024843 RepID=UPI0026334F23|nr:HAMP domain-containing sensor histidine kinase [Nitrosopumilus sp.]
MVRKDDGEVDPEKRTLYFSDKQRRSKSLLEQEGKDIKEESFAKKAIAKIDEEIEDKESRTLFSESFELIENFNNEKMKRMYSQLSEEKQLSKELNNKLNANLSKIANAEAELVDRKKKLEEELEVKTEQLIESERFAAIGELSSRLAHDLRSPLTVIKGMVGILKLKEGRIMDDAVIKRLELMEKSVFRMTHQIEGVLDYVQKMPLKKKEESLKDIIQTSYSSIEIPPNITIYPPKNDIVFNCDSVKMEVVFENLILNAIQAIGDSKGRIFVKLNENNKVVMATVQDSGEDIPLEEQEKIFEPLFTTKQEGTGLGLSSVKNIVELHGGQIALKASPKRFAMIFPKEESVKTEEGK